MKLTRKNLLEETNDAAVKELAGWLKNNPAIWLAYKLGYKGHATVEHWVRRGSIPGPQRHRVLKMIRQHPTVSL